MKCFGVSCLNDFVLPSSQTDERFNASTGFLGHLLDQHFMIPKWNCDSRGPSKPCRNLIGFWKIFCSKGIFTHILEVILETICGLFIEKTQIFSTCSVSFYILRDVNQIWLPTIGQKIYLSLWLCVKRMVHLGPVISASFLVLLQMWVHWGCMGSTTRFWESLFFGLPVSPWYHDISMLGVAFRNKQSNCWQFYFFFFNCFNFNFNISASVDLVPITGNRELRNVSLYPDTATLFYIGDE